MTPALEIFQARAVWAHAVLARELADGRSAGYLPGDAPTELVDPTSLRAQITARIDPRPNPTSPMGRIVERFALADLEEDVLWLLACCEVEPNLSRFVEALASSGMNQLSVQHVARMIGVSSRVLEQLAMLGLVELDVDPHQPIHRRKLRTTDRVLDLLRGELGADPAIAALTMAIEPDTGIAVPVALQHVARCPDDLLAIAVGSEGGDRDAILCAAAGFGVLRVQCSELSATPSSLERELRAIVREARLANLRLLFSGADVILEAAAFDRIVLANVRGPILASVRELGPRSASGPRTTITHTVRPLDADERRLRWSRELGITDSTALEACVDRYRLPGAMIRHAARAIRATGLELKADSVQAVLRDRLDRRLSGLARRIEWQQSWADLVLPDDQLDLLVELVARVRFRKTVLADWGFEAKVGKGIGTAALFSGPPGTGKTMIAGLVARELGLDLYQVDLSKVVSKYIGETEQRLAELFDAAEFGQAIILFDEADSLFGKRTDVKSSNDRYANLETNYLLQRLEAFQGICVLTTNHEAAIDAAFMRRLSLHVRVPMPDEDQRAALWRAMIPTSAAVGPDLELATLAREFTMSGGYIKNAVLRAAYLAAAEASAIGNTHLWRAARLEYEGMGKLAYGA